MCWGWDEITRNVVSYLAGHLPLIAYPQDLIQVFQAVERLDTMSSMHRVFYPTFTQGHIQKFKYSC